MKFTDEESFCIRQAKQADFLSSRIKFEQYASALLRAVLWGKKKDKENKEYFSKNHLIDKYNI